MQRNQIIKDIIAGLILSCNIPLFYLIKHYDLIKNKTILNILFYIFGLINMFLIFGIFFYIGFKIMRGTTFIYKDPNQAKTLNNVDLGESLPDVICRSRGDFHKSINYDKELPGEKNYYLRKFFSFFGWMILITLIIFFGHIITKQRVVVVRGTVLYILIQVLFIIFILTGLYGICEEFGTLWVYYVKLFQLLGVFRFLESDFDKTINSHNYFPISIWYYEKLKPPQKPKTIWNRLFWFIFWFIIIIVILFIIFGITKK